MLNTRKRMQETISTQAELIKNRDKFIEQQREENHILYKEKKQYAEENAGLREENTDYRQALRKIIAECKNQQYNSLENLQNKIVSLATTAIEN